MDVKRRSSIATALVLIGIGGWFLAVQVVPSLYGWAYGAATWPLPIIGIGAGLLVIGLITFTPGLAVPACIVGGIGGLLYWQNSADNWESWAYAWALIPGFVGAGIILSGLLSRDRGAIIGGAWTILVSLVMFAIFGSFLGGPELVSTYWPIIPIVLGVILLGQALFRRR